MIVLDKPLFKGLELNKIRPLTLVLAAAAGLILPYLVQVIFDVLIPFPESWIRDFTDAFVFMDIAPAWSIILAVGIMGPIAEEICFRGGIFNAMRRDSNSIAAVIVSSLLFGAMHMIPFQICYATLVGVILGVICVVTKSAWPAILVHIVNNMCGIVIPESLNDSIIGFMTSGPAAPWIATVLLAAALAACIFGMARLQRKSGFRIAAYVSRNAKNALFSGEKGCAEKL